MESELKQIKEIYQQIVKADNLTDYDNIELPFQLLDAVMELLESAFEPTVLQQLGE